MEKKILVERHTPDGVASVAAEQVLARAKQGEILLVRNGLQAAGVFDLLRTMVLDSIEELAGAVLRQEVDRQGLHKLHEILPIDLLMGLNPVMTARSRSLSGPVMHALNQALMGMGENFHFEDGPNIRIFCPQDFIALHPQEFSGFSQSFGGGRLTLHGPHQDDRHFHPIGSMNIWCALGRVQKNNGMTFYPDFYGHLLPYTLDDGNIRADQYLGRPLFMSLNPGDVLIFGTENIHTSTVNQTNDTRVAISFRVTPDQPRFRSKTWYSYVKVSDCDESGPPSFQIDYSERPDPTPVTLDTRFRMPPPVLMTEQVDGSIEIPGAMVPENCIRVVSNHFCIARVGGIPVIFERRCPHQGADLAGGNVLNGQIVCPWHSLSMSPVDGHSACQSVDALALIPCSESEGRIRIVPPDCSRLSDDLIVPQTHSIEHEASRNPSAASRQNQAYISMLEGVARERLEVLETVHAEAEKRQQLIDLLNTRLEERDRQLAAAGAQFLPRVRVSALIRRLRSEFRSLRNRLLSSSVVSFQAEHQADQHVNQNPSPSAMSASGWEQAQGSTQSTQVTACQIFNGIGSGNIGDELMSSAFWAQLPGSVVLEAALMPQSAGYRGVYPSRHRYCDVDWQGNENGQANVPGLLVCGTPVSETEGIDWPLSFLAPRLMHFHERNLPVDAVGVGVELLRSPEALELFSKGFAPIRSWTVRNEASEQALLALGVDPAIIKVGADWAWLHTQRDDLQQWAHDWWSGHGIDPAQPLLVVNVVNMQWQDRMTVRVAIAAALDHAVRHHGMQIAFICNECRDGVFFDHAAAMQMTGFMKHSAVILPNLFYSPDEVIALLRYATLTIGQRYHFLVESVLAGTLPIAIPRGAKIRELADELGLQSVGSVLDVDQAELIGAIDLGLSERSSRILRLVAHQQHFATRASRNLDFISQYEPYCTHWSRSA